MKRVLEACVIQKLHFQLKDGISSEYNKKAVKEEVERYKKQLERNGGKYNITSEAEQSDGSVIIDIKKQYNTSPVGTLLD